MQPAITSAQFLDVLLVMILGAFGLWVYSTAAELIRRKRK